MAYENAEANLDSFVVDVAGDTAADSSKLRISSNTAFESGIPPARLRDGRSLDSGIEAMEVALASATRSEANLGLMVRGLRHVADGAEAAREANRALAGELESLRTLFGRVAEQEHALLFRIAQLEHLLDVARQEASRERQFLIDQQDLFLGEIMSDHDRQMSELRRSLQGGPQRTAEAAQREIAELTAQRDQAREYATRCERERDAAWHELAAAEMTPVPVTIQRNAPAILAVPRTSPPPPPAAEDDFSELSDEELKGAQKSSATAIGSISLRAVQVPASHLSSAENARVSSTSTSRAPSSGTARVSSTSNQRTSTSGDPIASSYSLSGEDVHD